MRRTLTGAAAAAIALPAWADEAAAHALAQRYDLPLPLPYFLLAAGFAVALSFLVLAIFWRPKEERVDAGHVLAAGEIPSPLPLVGQMLVVGFLVLIVAAGLLGYQGTFKNIAPVAVWVVWWIGFNLLSAFIGNVWAVINPWSAIFTFAERLARPSLGKLSLDRPYPAGFGMWPACFLFLLFAWLELVAPGRDVPRNIAIGALAYSAITLLGYAAFGRDAWQRNGEVFSVAFGLLGRFAPLGFARNGRWHFELRFYGMGLLTKKPLAPSAVAFTLLLLATVTVDGLMETPLWAGTVEWIAGREAAGAGSWAQMLLPSMMLITGPLLLAGLYFAAMAVMARITRTPIRMLAGIFVLSLVPIAVGYYLAHYFSLLAIAGQFIIPLASDPFGFGWNLFGTKLYRIDIGIVDARFIWYLAVAAIVGGHVMAVAVAHLAAHELFRDGAAARRSQYPMLVLMVAYTMLSLWILAQPIVEGP